MAGCVAAGSAPPSRARLRRAQPQCPPGPSAACYSLLTGGCVRTAAPRARIGRGYRPFAPVARGLPRAACVLFHWPAPPSPLDAVRSPPAARCVGVCEELRHSRARPLPLQAEAGMAGVGTHTHRASVAASRAREVAAMPQRARDPVLHGPAVQRRMSRRSRRNGGVTVGRTATAWCDGPERRASSLSCCGAAGTGCRPASEKQQLTGAWRVRGTYCCDGACC